MSKETSLPTDWIAGVRYVKEKKRAERLDTLKKWLMFFGYIFGGLGFCGGVLWIYIMMILLVGSP